MLSPLPTDIEVQLEAASLGKCQRMNTLTSDLLQGLTIGQTQLEAKENTFIQGQSPWAETKVKNGGEWISGTV